MKRKAILVLVIMIFIPIGASNWAQERGTFEPIKLPEVIIMGEDTTVLKEMKEKLQPTDIWYGLEKKRPDIKQELSFLETTPITKDTPKENRPGWFYRNSITAPFMKLLAREKAYYKIGLHKFQEGDFTEAIKTWETLLRKYRHGNYRGEALFWLGEAYGTTGDSAQALKSYEEMVRDYPGHRYVSYGYLSLGWIHLEKKDYKHAENAFASLIKYAPARSPVLASLGYYLHGGALYSQEKFREAGQAFEELITKLPNSALVDKALFWQAECFYNARDYPNALKLYGEYLQKYATTPLAERALYSLAWSQVNIKDFAQGLASWEQLEKRFPQSHLKGSAFIGKIRALLGLRELHKAKSFLENYQAQHPFQDPWLDKAMFEIAVYEIEQKNFREAIRILSRLLKEYPDSSLKPLALFLLGEGYYQLKEYFKAIEYYRQSEKFPATHFMAFQLDQKVLLRIGLSYYQAGEYESAARTLEDFLQRFSDSPYVDEANFWLAESRFQQEEFIEALKAYGEISAEGQNVDYALYGKAWVLYRTEKWQEAAPLFQQLIDKYPKSILLPEALFRLGECYFNLKEYDKAYAYFQRLLEEFPQSNLQEAGLFQLGWISYKKEKYPEARRAFAELLVRLPLGDWSDDAQYWYGMSYFLEEEYPVARGELMKVVINYPESPYAFRAFMAIGDSYYNEENYKQALKTYKEIIDSYPSDPRIAEPEYAIIQTALQRKQKKGFFDLSQRFLAKYPHNPLSLTLMYQVGEQKLAGGDISGARKIYQDIIKKFPQNPQTDKAFSQIGELDFQAKDYGSALNSYQQLLALYPASSLRPVAQFKSAEAYFYLKEWEKARYGFERFIGEFYDHPLVPQALYYIGSCLFSSGQKDKAVAYFQRVITSFPQEPHSFRSYLEIGTIYSEKDEPLKARDWFAKATPSPDKEVSARAHFRLADSYTMTGDYQKGIEEYLKVAYLFPEQKELSAEALLRTGRNYEQLQKWSEAVSIYQKIMKEGKNPKSRELARKKIAEIKKRLGRK